MFLGYSLELESYKYNTGNFMQSLQPMMRALYEIDIELNDGVERNLLNFIITNDSHLFGTLMDIGANPSILRDPHHKAALMYLLAFFHIMEDMYGYPHTPTTTENIYDINHIRETAYYLHERIPSMLVVTPLDMPGQAPMV